MYIECKKSKKSEATYLVLVINGIFVSFDRSVIERVAMTNGISNIDLNHLGDGQKIKIEEV